MPKQSERRAIVFESEIGIQRIVNLLRSFTVISNTFSSILGFSKTFLKRISFSEALLGGAHFQHDFSRFYGSSKLFRIFFSIFVFYCEESHSGKWQSNNWSNLSTIECQLSFPSHLQLLLWLLLPHCKDFFCPTHSAGMFMP